MRFATRRRAVGIVAAVAALLVPAAIAWGCVALVGFRINGTSVVQPGGTLEIWGGEFARGKPVQIRLDSPEGPILATQPDPQPSTMTSQFTLAVPIPADVSPGQHFLVATQEHYDMNVGIPARAAFYVNTSAPVAPVPADRPAALLESDGPSAAKYVLIALGVAAGGLLLAALASAFAARRPSPPAERVKAS